MKPVPLALAAGVLAMTAAAQDRTATDAARPVLPRAGAPDAGRRDAAAPGTTATAARPDGARTNDPKDSNEAVATARDGADRPARGANSFGADQARGRIADRGFQDVSGLSKDDDGVWRGRATKDGRQVGVWLDYKGNVGQQ